MPLRPFTTATPPLDGEPEVPPLGEVLEFLRLLWALDHALGRMSKRMERDLGVTGPQRLVIRFIGRFPGISAGKLASLLHMHPSTLTGILRRLEARRLIARRVDARDGRRALFGLTHSGQRRDQREAGTVESVVDDVLRGSSAQEIEAAKALLTRLAHALERRNGEDDTPDRA